MGVLLLPIVFILVGGILLVSTLGSVFTAMQQGGIVEYDEYAFQDYADSRYAEAFGASDTYEDHILLVVLIDPEGLSDYNYIAWVGDHIDYSISDLFGDNSSVLGRTMSSCINPSSYKYSLDSNLAQVVETMAGKIDALHLDDSFRCQEDHYAADSYLLNQTSLPLTESTVNTELEEFSTKTGISMVIVVDEMEDVFGRTMPSSYIGMIAICGIFVVVGVAILIRSLRKKSKDTNSSL